MRLLPLRIGVGNQRTGLAQSKAPLPEQALALADPQMHLEPLLDPGAQGLAVPQRTAQSEVPGGLAQGSVDLSEMGFAQAPWAARTRAFGQPCETLGFKTSHPVLDGAWGVTQQTPHFWTGRPLGHQKYTMETMIIARLFRTANLVLQPEDHRFRIINSQWSHADMKPQFSCTRNYL